MISRRDFTQKRHIIHTCQSLAATRLHIGTLVEVLVLDISSKIFRSFQSLAQLGIMVHEQTMALLRHRAVILRARDSRTDLNINRALPKHKIRLRKHIVSPVDEHWSDVQSKFGGDIECTLMEASDRAIHSPRPLRENHQ